MPSRRLALIVLLILSVAGVAQHAWYWPRLPERVATHFGITGEADGWMNRTAAVGTLAGFQLVFPALLVLLGAVVWRLPNSVINMPYKEYWLAPERRAESLEWMGRMLAWVAVCTSLFTAAIAHLSFVANRDGTKLDLGPFAAAMGLYLAAVFGLTGWSLWRFGRPPPR